MREIDLTSLMKNLESSLKYYASVPPSGNLNYEENYHFKAIDPDGVERDLLNEREHSINSIKEITNYLDIQKPGRFLDIGCGLGWLLSYLNDDWEKYGVEISKFASEHASKFATIFNGNLDEYSTNLKFDYVCMNHVIEHLEDPIKALRKIYHMMAPQGKLILGTPDFDSAMARKFKNNFRLLHDPTHISLFSQDSLRRLLRDEGFQINFVEFPYFETDWFNKENLLKVLNNEGISPPFYGSTMTFFCQKL